MAVRPAAEAAIGQQHTPPPPGGCAVGLFATSRRPWGLRGHPRGLRRVNVTQAGSIGGFNDQGGCGCAHPAVSLFPLVPWASGMPRVAHRGAVGIARDPGPFCLKGYRLPTPQKRSKTGPGRPPRCRRWVSGCSGRPRGVSGDCALAHLGGLGLWFSDLGEPFIHQGRSRGRCARSRGI